MKKLIISIMAVMLFLTGCGKSQEKATLEKDIDNLQKENKELKDKKEKLQQEKEKLADKQKEIKRHHKISNQKIKLSHRIKIITKSLHQQIKIKKLMTNTNHNRIAYLL